VCGACSTHRRNEKCAAQNTLGGKFKGNILLLRREVSRCVEITVCEAEDWVQMAEENSVVALVNRARNLRIT